MSEGLERKDALWLWAIVNVRMRIGGTWPTTALVYNVRVGHNCGVCGNKCTSVETVEMRIAHVLASFLGEAAIQRLDIQRWSNGETLDMPSENCSRQQEQLLNRGSTTQT